MGRRFSRLVANLYALRAAVKINSKLIDSRSAIGMIILLFWLKIRIFRYPKTPRTDERSRLYRLIRKRRIWIRTDIDKILYL